MWIPKSRRIFFRAPLGHLVAAFLAEGIAIRAKTGNHDVQGLFFIIFRVNLNQHAGPAPGTTEQETNPRMAVSDLVKWDGSPCLTAHRANRPGGLRSSM